jgi:hypothetical protein
MVTRLVLFLPIVIACGARTELGGVGLDASTIGDAAPDDAHDAGLDAHDAAMDVQDAATDETSVPPLCDYGVLVSDAFGALTTWNGGAPVPAGHYRVTWVDGCMKYSSGQGWTVNAYANGPDTLYVVTDNDTAVVPAPGTVGFFVNQGAFAAFDDCVSANQSDAPVEFDFAGGTLGLHLSDSPYTDNVAGENGRNPTYRLSSCP